MEIETATVKDESGFLNDGVVTGAVYYQQGSTGWEMKFDGVDDSILIHEEILGNANSYSVSFWFKTDKAEDESLTEHWQGEQKYPWAIRGPYLNGSISWLIYNGVESDGIATTLKDYGDLQFHHIVIIRDYENSKIKLYMDNTLEGEKTNSFEDVSDSGNQFSIMSRSGTAKFRTGSIKEFRIYEKALNIEEIDKLYKFQDVREGLIGCWSMNYPGQTGKNTSRFIKTEWPITKGLIAGTTKQEGNISNLIPQKSFIEERFKEGI